ncbi:O-antigen polysaccharide polymerase Wzy [Acinetobacter piscicola]|uniref:O-antigen polysaccharide polymerase Wzy n=1 Tax=Acinetobacter piscicola TaxID=2006115 RepID=UPI00101EEB54|nr:O-antigen polysaccharide polymerase Wzy [Acinetobacter piscicola]RYL21704.1 O-antigen polysaccharide polymerase Wzy [Acinetobacter piscicola]
MGYNNLVIRNIKISIFILVSLLLLVMSLYYLDIQLYIPDYWWSVLFLTFILVIFFLRIVNGFLWVSIYSLFFFTTLIFICSRFFVNFLGDWNYGIDELDFFIYKKLGGAEFSQLFYLIIIIIISLELGYYFSRILLKKNDEIDFNLLKFNGYFLVVLSLLIWIPLLYSAITSFFKVSSSGYTELYSSQLSSYGFDFFSLLYTFSLVLTGIYLNQSNKVSRLFFVFLMGVYYFILFLSGIRGGFICYLLFIMWYINGYGLFQKYSNIKLMLYLMGLGGVVIFLFKMISLRTLDDNNSLGLILSIQDFLYSQGVTLLVFYESIILEDYPIIPYFQNFIPGFSFFYSQLIEPIDGYNKNFGQYLSYELNPIAYQNGYGLGWSIFSDLYLYSFKVIPIFAVLCMIFSFFINYLQLKSNGNTFYRIILTSSVISILFLPRAGLNTFIPLLIYTVATIVILMFLGRYKNI